MGQSYMLVNIDKREYCDAHDLGGMSKLGEWCTSPQSLVFPYLMALCDGSGGGDPEIEGLKYLGRWAGDRVVLVGCYWGNSDEKLPFANLYEEVADNDLEWHEQVVKELKAELKTGYPYYMGSNKYTYFIPEQKKRLLQLKERLKILRQKPRNERYINISEDVKREFESLYGTNALDWQKSQYIHGVGMPDMVLGMRPPSKNKLTT